MEGKVNEQMEMVRRSAKKRGLLQKLERIQRSSDCITEESRAELLSSEAKSSGVEALRIISLPG